MLAWRFLEELRDINKITTSLYSMVGKQHFGTMLMDGVPFSMSAEIMKLSKCINMIIINYYDNGLQFIDLCEPYLQVFCIVFDYMYLHRYSKKNSNSSQLGLL